MATDIYQSAFAVCERLKAEHGGHALVAFSGGKESLCVLDIACQVFDRVSAFHMEWVPGMRVVEDVIEWAESRYGVQVKRYPHPAMLMAKMSGQYCFSTWRFDKIRDIEEADMYRLASHDHPGSVLLVGARRSDSLRRRMLIDRGVYFGHQPLADWNSHHVYAYIKRKNIPLPSRPSKGITSGVGVDHPTLRWLYDHHPDDYRLLRAEFPFIDASIRRAELYGFRTDQSRA